jgi:hypothetical protein
MLKTVPAYVAIVPADNASVPAVVATVLADDATI